MVMEVVSPDLGVLSLEVGYEICLGKESASVVRARKSARSFPISV